MIGGEANRGIRMERAGFRKPPVLQPKHLLPGHALLASTAQCVPPEPQQSMPESSQAADVSRDRVVVETASSRPCQVPSVSPHGAPVEPCRPLASNVRTALGRECPSPVRIPSSFRHRYRLHPDDSSASRSL